MGKMPISVTDRAQLLRRPPVCYMLLQSAVIPRAVEKDSIAPLGTSAAQHQWLHLHMHTTSHCHICSKHTAINNASLRPHCLRRKRFVTPTQLLSLIHILIHSQQPFWIVSDCIRVKRCKDLSAL